MSIASTVMAAGLARPEIALGDLRPRIEDHQRYHHRDSGDVDREALRRERDEREEDDGEDDDCRSAAARRVRQ